jgi:GDP-4-dehydro-6-deoxy-D-mannose reductase
MRVIVTGVDSFVGRHLGRLAMTEGVELIGVGLPSILDPDVAALFAEYHEVDLREHWPDDIRGDAIIHLPGHAAVGPSFTHPQSYVADNAAITIRMCEWILATPALRSTRIVGISSSTVYHSNASPIDEAAPIAYASPYAIGKVLVEHLLDYYRGRGLDTVVVRPFNHIGPGQNPGTLIPDLVARLRTVEPGDAMATGNLDSRRDYTDVRDVVRAYLTLATCERPAHDVYNVASGIAYSGRDILETICRAESRPVPALTSDAAQDRHVDADVFVGDASRLESEFGWHPTIGLEQSIADYIEWADFTESATCRTERRAR